MIVFKDHNPQTLYEAVNLIVNRLDPEELEYIKENGNSGLHHSFGMHMRNGWGLWHDGLIAQHIKETYGLGHADDMSGLILDIVVARVRGEEFDIEDEVQKYKEYWWDLGIDPLTQENLP